MNDTTILALYLIPYYLWMACFLFCFTSIYDPVHDRRVSMWVVNSLVLLWPVYLLVYLAHLAIVVAYQRRGK